MATTNQIIGLEEFLRSPRFERFEYNDGVVTEKPMPNWKHGELCGWILALLLKFYPAYVAAPEVRSRLKLNQWKLPDILVALREQRRGEYAVRPGHLAIEILSKDDAPQTMFEKCKEYHAWGVPYCWILDPESETAWQCTQGEQPVVAQTLTAGPISFEASVLFSCLHDGFSPTLLNA